MITYRTAVIGSLLSALACVGAAHAQERLTPSQAIEATLSANPQMVAARAAADEAGQQGERSRIGDHGSGHQLHGETTHPQLDRRA